MKEFISLFIIIIVIQIIKCQLDGLDEIEQYIQSKIHKQGSHINFDEDPFINNGNKNNYNPQKGDITQPITPVHCDYSKMDFLKNIAYTVSEQGIINISNLIELTIEKPIDLDQIDCPFFRIIFSNMYFLSIQGLKATNRTFDGPLHNNNNRRQSQQIFYFKNITKVILENVNFYNITFNHLTLFEIDQNVQYFGLSSIQMRYISTDQPFFVVAQKFEKIKIENITLQNIKQNNHMRLFNLQCGSGVEITDITIQGRQDISMEGFFTFSDIKNVKIENIKLENVFVMLSTEYESSNIESNLL